MNALIKQIGRFTIDIKITKQIKINKKEFKRYIENINKDVYKNVKDEHYIKQFSKIYTYDKLIERYIHFLLLSSEFKKTTYILVYEYVKQNYKNMNTSFTNDKLRNAVSHDYWTLYEYIKFNNYKLLDKVINNKIKKIIEIDFKEYIKQTLSYDKLSKIIL